MNGGFLNQILIFAKPDKFYVYKIARMRYGFKNWLKQV
jgi:hypothetical protein